MTIVAVLKKVAVIADRLPRSDFHFLNGEIPFLTRISSVIPMRLEGVHRIVYFLGVCAEIEEEMVRSAIVFNTNSEASVKPTGDAPTDVIRGVLFEFEAVVAKLLDHTVVDDVEITRGVLHLNSHFGDAGRDAIADSLVKCELSAREIVDRAVVVGKRFDEEIANVKVRCDVVVCCKFSNVLRNLLSRGRSRKSGIGNLGKVFNNRGVEFNYKATSFRQMVSVLCRAHLWRVAGLPK